MSLQGRGMPVKRQCCKARAALQLWHGIGVARPEVFVMTDICPTCADYWLAEPNSAHDKRSGGIDLPREVPSRQRLEQT